MPMFTSLTKDIPSASVWPREHTSRGLHRRLVCDCRENGTTCYNASKKCDLFVLYLDYFGR